MVQLRSHWATQTQSKTRKENQSRNREKQRKSKWVEKRRQPGKKRMNNGFSTGEEDSRGHTDQTCCLIDDMERCRNQAGYASYSKRIQKTVAQKRLKLSSDPSAQHIYICDHHKDRIQSVRTKRRRKDSEDDSNETDTDLHEFPDLHKLGVSALRRYKRHFNVQTRQGMKRAQLADTIMKHFKTIPIKEKEIITFFVYRVKMGSNKLDQKNGIGNDTT